MKPSSSYSMRRLSSSTILESWTSHLLISSKVNHPFHITSIYCTRQLCCKMMSNIYASTTQKDFGNNGKSSIAETTFGNLNLAKLPKKLKTKWRDYVNLTWFLRLSGQRQNIFKHRPNGNPKWLPSLRTQNINKSAENCQK